MDIILQEVTYGEVKQNIALSAPVIYAHTASAVLHNSLDMSAPC